MTRPEAVRDAEQAELAQQLRKLRQRRGLGDETRVATHAPMLLQLAQRCMDLEHGEQSPLLPRALQLVQDGLWACAPGSRELLEDGLNLVRIEDSTKEERLMDYVVRNSLAEVEPVLKREDKLYEVLAAFILEEVALSRARATHWAMANGSGDATAAALFIAEQFKHYFRVFAQMSGVGNDVQAYLIRRWRDPDDVQPKYLTSTIHRFGLWELALRDFTHEQGGNWIASSAEREEALVSRVYTARLLLPIGDFEASQLRAVMSAGHIEIEPMIAGIGPRTFASWVRRLRAWVDLCDCNPRRPKKRCEPHQLIRICEEFTVIVEQEWYRLSSWYHISPEIVPAAANLSADYFLSAPREAYKLAEDE